MPLKNKIAKIVPTHHITFVYFTTTEPLIVEHDAKTDAKAAFYLDFALAMLNTDALVIGEQYDVTIKGAVWLLYANITITQSK